MEVNGLRTAKRIVRKQSVVVKGERGYFAKGYRRALADVMVKIDAEIRAVEEEQSKGAPRDRTDLLEAGWSVDEVLAEIDEMHKPRELTAIELAEMERTFAEVVQNDDRLMRLMQMPTAVMRDMKRQK